MQQFANKIGEPPPSRHGIVYSLDGKTITQEWRDAFAFQVMDPTGAKVVHYYCPSPKGLDFHESECPNLLMEGSRGTGKSTIMRNDAHMRAMTCPGFTYLIVRRTMPELKKSHLKFISAEMNALGGRYHKTDHIAYYPNGSMGFFGHCETEEDMMKLLSSEYDGIYIDEMTTFTWAMITKIASCTRVQEGSGKIAFVRGGTNPLGVGADDVRRHYISKDVNYEEEPDYDAADYDSIHMTLDDNIHIDRVQYVKTLSKLPAHVRKAWLEGLWIAEGTYFFDFAPFKNDKPWHVINELPEIESFTTKERKSVDDPFNWLLFYRAVDWGFSPDPAVCLWGAMLPNGRLTILKERDWKATAARLVATDINTDSRDMRIVETFCDPTMYVGSEATEHNSTGDIFDACGVYLSKSRNDRAAIGYAIHEYFVTVLDDGLPKIQIYGPGCPNLVRTIPDMRIDKNDPTRIANGNDHWVIALGYMCLGRLSESREPNISKIPRWMRPNPNLRSGRKLGDESVRIR